MIITAFILSESVLAGLVAAEMLPFNYRFFCIPLLLASIYKLLAYLTTCAVQEFVETAEALNVETSLSKDDRFSEVSAAFWLIVQAGLYAIKASGVAHLSMFVVFGPLIVDLIVFGFIESLLAWIVKMYGNNFD